MSAIFALVLLALGSAKENWIVIAASGVFALLSIADAIRDEGKRR